MPTSSPVPHDRGFFGQPRGLATLFFTEMWERFSFYGMRALLLLYLTAEIADGGLGYDAAKGAAIYALYTSSVYLMGLPGGWLADRLLGQRRAVFLGGVFIALGHFVMILPALPAFYLGLVTIVLGVGLLKTNVSVIVGQLYGADDRRRDSGFSLFYMGINFGALLGPMICSFIGERYDWRLGFAVAGFGMVIGLVQYVLGGHYLGEAGLHPFRDPDPEKEAIRRRRILLGLGAVVSVVVILAALWVDGTISVSVETLSNSFGVFLSILTVVFFAWLFSAHRWTPVERGRLAAIVVLFLAASIFWGAYEQAGSSLNLFARDFTNRHVAFTDFEYPAGWFQPVPALFVLILAPVFAWLWIRLGSRQPSSPTKFALGLVFVSLGFGVMMAASTFASAGAQVSPMWLVLTYWLHVIGEMCLSPVGLSTVTKLAPQRVAGLMMGVWFLAASVGNYVGGRAAGFYETLPLWGLFGIFAAVTMGAGLILALLVRPIRRLMGGVH